MDWWKKRERDGGKGGKLMKGRMMDNEGEG